MITEIQKEIELLKSLKHQNIVSYIGVKKYNNEKYMIMEFMGGGNLLLYIQKNEKNLAELDFLNMAKQIAAGMAYLEEKQIIHRDLALRNILCKIEMTGVTCKVADFGLSRTTQDGTYKIHSENPLPVKWSAPELIFKNIATSKSDVFSFGVVLFELFSKGKLNFFPILF